MTIECSCGRGTFTEGRFNSCYFCYEDRRATYDACVMCGAWHNPTFVLCYKCRQGEDKDAREEAAGAMRELIFRLDGYACTECGKGIADESLQIDHIQPCKSGGGAQPWNMRTLCRPCCIEKGTDWDHVYVMILIDRMAMFYASSILVDTLQGSEYSDMVAKMDDLMATTDWHSPKPLVHDSEVVHRFMAVHPGSVKYLARNPSVADGVMEIPFGTRANEIGPCAKCSSPMVRYGQNAQGTVCASCKKSLSCDRYRRNR